MHHHRGAVAVEQRVVPPEGVAWCGDLARCRAVRCHGDVTNVAEMGALGIVGPMLAVCWVPVSPGGGELWPLALACGVQMNSVLARRESDESAGQSYAVTPVAERQGAKISSRGVTHLGGHLRGLRGGH